MFDVYKLQSQKRPAANSSGETRPQGSCEQTGTLLDSAPWTPVVLNTVKLAEGSCYWPSVLVHGVLSLRQS